MLERVRYVNSRGEVLEFGKNGIYVNQNDLRDWEWTYNADYGKIRSLRRATKEKTLPVYVWADTEAKGVAMKNRIHDVTEVDVLAGTPGKLYIGDWYQHCYVVRSEKSDYLIHKSILVLTLTLAMESGPWYCAQLSSFGGQTGLVSAVVGEALVGFARVGQTGNQATEIDVYPVFENYTVEGQTIQAGTGDPSPSNVRAITGVGMMDAMTVLDGSADEAWYRYTDETVQTKSSVFYLDIPDSVMALDSSLASSFANTKSDAKNARHVENDGRTMIYTDHPGRTTKYFRWGGPDATVEEFRAWLAENPVTLWYTKATHEEGDAYYAGVSTEKAGAYYGKAVEVPRPLFDGDKVRTYVEKDGAARSVATYAKGWLVLDGVNAAFTLFSSAYAMVRLSGLRASGSVVCSHLASSTTTGVWLGSSGAAFMLAGLPSTATDLAKANAWLAEQYAAGTPVTLVYELAEADVYEGDPVVLVEMMDSYRYDYPREYSLSGSNDYLLNDTIADCDWKITIHGPAANPSITIGNSIHRLQYTIPAGRYVEIDSRQRTITLYGENGPISSLFRNRDKDHDIFARIPAGSHSLRWNGEYNFSVELFKERSEPLWT